MRSPCWWSVSFIPLYCTKTTFITLPDHNQTKRPEARQTRTNSTSVYPVLSLIPVSQAEILGNSELHLKSGSDINLTCIVREAPEPPSFIYWYHGKKVINYSQRGGNSSTYIINTHLTPTRAILAIMPSLSWHRINYCALVYSRRYLSRPDEWNSLCLIDRQ